MPKPNIEVRNPRYAGATPGDIVRSLMRPPKPKGDKPSKPAPADTPADTQPKEKDS